jgi:glycosyltransferase involved in cell wall biosynthesis
MPDLNKPLLSFVITVRDRSAFLYEALASIKIQTLEYWECIIVDDYSSEDIRAVVSSMEDERFKYFRNPGTPGISAARNFGNRQALAEWIAVADSDDINVPRRMEATLDAVWANPGCEIVYAPMYFVANGTHDVIYEKCWGPPKREDIYLRNPIAHGSAAYLRSAAYACPYNETLVSAVDYDLWLSFADEGKKFVYFDEPVAIYRIHAGQISWGKSAILQAENAEKARIAHL